MKEFRFKMENQPGALAKVASALGEERVNIEGIAGTAVDNEGVIRLVTDNPGKTRNVLQNLGVDFEEKEALAIDVPNHPGELATLLRRLADEGLNVESCYISEEPNKVVVALTVDDVARAKQILRIA
jgi:hypothetical protein